MPDWKKQTCGNCDYFTADRCRRYPPEVEHGDRVGMLFNHFKPVKATWPACGEWRTAE